MAVAVLVAAAGGAYLLPGPGTQDRAPQPAGMSLPIFALPAPTAEMESGISEEERHEAGASAQPSVRPKPSAAKAKAPVSTRTPSPAAARPAPAPPAAAASPHPVGVSQAPHSAGTASGQSQGGSGTAGDSAAAPPQARAPEPPGGTPGEGDRVQASRPAAAPTPAPAAAASPIARPVLAPPVPVSLTPPRHPEMSRVIVEAPGLVAAARPEVSAARVRLRLLVTDDGSVGRVEVASGSGRPELDAAAVDAARSWRFLPARRDGVPIASYVLIWVAFVVEP